MLTKIVFVWILSNPVTGDIDVRAVSAPSMETCNAVGRSGHIEANAAKYGLEVIASRCEIVEWKQ